MMRLGAKTNSPNIARERVLFQVHNNVPFLFEAIVTFIRRFMIGHMRSPGLLAFTVVMTAVEEGVSRATIVERDRLCRRLLRLKPHDTKAAQVKQRCIWMTQIGNSMIIEPCSILLHAIVIIFMTNQSELKSPRPHIQSAAARWR